MLFWAAEKFSMAVCIPTPVASPMPAIDLTRTSASAPVILKPRTAPSRTSPKVPKETPNSLRTVAVYDSVAPDSSKTAKRPFMFWANCWDPFTPSSIRPKTPTPFSPNSEIFANRPPSPDNSSSRSPVFFMDSLSAS